MFSFNTVLRFLGPR